MAGKNIIARALAYVQYFLYLCAQIDQNEFYVLHFNVP